MLTECREPFCLKKGNHHDRLNVLSHGFDLLQGGVMRVEYRAVVFDWVQGGMIFDCQKETVILDWVEGFVALAWM